MKFSVLIVNYASWFLTLRCVESLYESGNVGFEVVVVDNDQVEPPEQAFRVRRHVLVLNSESRGQQAYVKGPGLRQCRT